MKRLSKRTRIVLIIVGSLIALIVGIRCGWEALLTVKLKRVAREMGLSWPPRVTPSPIDASTNAAPVYRMAWNFLEALPSNPEGEDSEDAKLEAAAGDSLFDKLQADEYDNLLEDIEVLRAYRERQEAGLKLLLEAASREECDFQVDFSQGLEAPMPHLAKLRTAARVLGFAAIVAAADGDPDAAAEYSWAIFRIGNHLANESYAISRLVRCAIFHIGYDYLRDISSLCGIPEDWRGRIDHELSRYEDWDTWLDMTDDRVMTLRTVEMALNGEATSDEYDSVFLLSPREILRQSLNWLVFDSWLLGPPIVKMNLIKYLELLAEFDESDRNPDYELSDEYWAYAWEGDFPPHYSVAGALTELGHIGLARGRSSARKVRTKASLARVALPLSAYKQKTGSYPDDLGILTPDFITEIPLDPYGNEPLIYRREDEGFIVYSVGYDHEDDGGIYEPEEGKFWPEKDDIAWRMSH